MRHSLVRSFVTFLLVLALTVGTIATLSTVTAAKAETAPARYSQQVRESQSAGAEVLSATVREEDAATLQSFGAFALILLVTGGGMVLLLRVRKNAGKGRAPSGRRYSPRDDRTFRSGAFQSEM